MSIFRSEAAADGHADSQHREERRRDRGGRDRVRAVCVAENDVSRRNARQLLDRSRLTVADVIEWFSRYLK